VMENAMELGVFQPGDLVRLRSGGPAMVVVENCLTWLVPWAEQTIATMWFNRSGKSQSAQFPLSALVGIPDAGE